MLKRRNVVLSLICFMFLFIAHSSIVLADSEVDDKEANIDFILEQAMEHGEPKTVIVIDRRVFEIPVSPAARHIPNPMNSDETVPVSPGPYDGEIPFLQTGRIFYIQSSTVLYILLILTAFTVYGFWTIRDHNELKRKKLR